MEKLPLVRQQGEHKQIPMDTCEDVCHCEKCYSSTVDNHFRKIRSVQTPLLISRRARMNKINNKRNQGSR